MLFELIKGVVWKLRYEFEKEFNSNSVIVAFYQYRASEF